MAQLDLPMPDATLAKAYRDAADAALRNPFETPDACERRAQYYREQAERIEMGEAH